MLDCLAVERGRDLFQAFIERVEQNDAVVFEQSRHQARKSQGKARARRVAFTKILLYCRYEFRTRKLRNKFIDGCVDAIIYLDKADRSLNLMVKRFVANVF